MPITTNRARIINTRKPMVSDFMNMKDISKETYTAKNITSSIEEVIHDEVDSLIQIIKNGNSDLMDLIKGYDVNLLTNMDNMIRKLIDMDLNTLGATIGVKQLLTDALRSTGELNGNIAILNDARIMEKLQTFVMTVITLNSHSIIGNDNIAFIRSLIDEGHITEDSYTLAIDYLLTNDINISNSSMVISDLLELNEDINILSSISSVKSKMITYLRDNNADVDMKELMIKLNQLEDEGYLEYTDNAILIKSIGAQIHTSTPSLPTMDDVSDTLDSLKLIYLVGMNKIDKF